MEKMTLTVADLQKAMGIGRNAAYNLVNREDFPKILVGKKIIIPREAFTRWLNDQTVRAR